MGIDIVKCGGELFIDNESMHRSAFCILSELSPLSRRRAHTVGNLTIPEVDGELARRMQANGAEHPLTLRGQALAAGPQSLAEIAHPTNVCRHHGGTRIPAPRRRCTGAGCGASSGRPEKARRLVE